jgi:hypothetical protein
MPSDVYHLNQKYFIMFLPLTFGSGEDIKRLARECWDDNGYTHVATVESDNPNDVYRLTNSIDRGWWENDGVEVHVETPVRSTSVGDLIVTGQDHLIVGPIGFETLPKKHRFQVHHKSPQYPCQRDYCVYDTQDRKIVFTSHSKSEVISIAQRRNGFKPIDGDERTYAQQIAEPKRS